MYSKKKLLAGGRDGKSRLVEVAEVGQLGWRGVKFREHI